MLKSKVKNEKIWQQLCFQVTNAAIPDKVTKYFLNSTHNIPSAF